MTSDCQYDIISTSLFPLGLMKQIFDNQKINYLLVSKPLALHCDLSVQTKTKTADMVIAAMMVHIIPILVADS